tara:strand:- start:154 stop:333 length:180 start_codon:yes stop_codon:yes gene_type:complete
MMLHPAHELEPPANPVRFKAAKDKINEYVDLGFVTDVVRDEKGYLGFCYDPERFARMRK